jgi:tripartite motif-containing protein 71
VGVAVDGAGVVYVADNGNSRIQMFTGTGSYLGEWGSPGGENGQFRYVNGVGLDANGNVFVTDAENYRVQKFGTPATPARPTTWGRIKATFRH